MKKAATRTKRKSTKRAGAGKTTAARARPRPGGAKRPRGAPARSPADDWRAAVLARVRRLIRQADPEMIEDVKWRKPSNGMAGVPVWSHAGIVCTGETYKAAVKLTFMKGASLDDPAGLFNAGLTGGTRRAIDIREHEAIDAAALKALIRAAVALNASPAPGRAAVAARPARR